MGWVSVDSVDGSKDGCGKSSGVGRESGTKQWIPGTKGCQDERFIGRI